MQYVAEILVYLRLTEPKWKVIQIQHSIDDRNTKIFHRLTQQAWQLGVIYLF